MRTERAIRPVQGLVDEIQGNGARSVEDQLNLLIDHFSAAVRIIDPNIRWVHVGYEGEGKAKPFCIWIDREGSTFSWKGLV